MLRVELGGHERRRARQSERRLALVVHVLAPRQPEVPDAQVALLPVDEHVVALEVAVDHGGVLGVEVVEALEDVAAPPLHHLPADHLDLVDELFQAE